MEDFCLILMDKMTDTINIYKYIAKGFANGLAMFREEDTLWQWKELVKFSRKAIREKRLRIRENLLVRRALEQVWYRVKLL